jgi:hypothetical protein
MDQEIPWWKYERPTPKEQRRIMAWFFLGFGVLAGAQYFSGSSRQYAGEFTLMYLYGSAFLFWWSTRNKD